MFDVDLRSLALFRISLGGVVAVDTICRLTDLTAHYGDAGVLPRGVLIEKFLNANYASVFLVNGTDFFNALLFVITIIAALAMMIGWRTRPMTVLSWLLMISVHARNPMVLQAGDVLFRLLLFWGMFLPLGARMSVDARIAAPDQIPKENRHRSIAGAAILLQVALIYWFTVLQKTGAEWWPDGTAVYYALHIDIFATRAGVWIRQFPEVLRFFTFASMVAEAGLPFLLLAPIFQTQLRTIGALSFMAMHASFGFFMELGNFPWVDWVSFLPFFPTGLWDFTKKKWGSRALPTWATKVKERGEKIFIAVKSRAPLLLIYKPKIELKGWTPEFLAAGALIMCIWWNLTTVPSLSISVHSNVRWIASVFRLDQNWSMFAPFPLKDDGWYVMEGKTLNGDVVDVYHLTMGAPSYDKPAHVADEFPNQRWRKYMMNIWLATNSGHRLHLGKYLCRRWNNAQSDDRRLHEYKIFYMREDTLPDYKAPEVKKVEVWSHNCIK